MKIANKVAVLNNIQSINITYNLHNLNQLLGLMKTFSNFDLFVKFFFPLINVEL